MYPYNINSSRKATPLNTMGTLQAATSKKTETITDAKILEMLGALPR